jgi:ribonuclease III
MTKDKRRRPPTTHLEAAFGVALDPELLERALTHRSFAYENGGLPTNERLEFLGDSVLGVVITTALFHNHPDLPEGQLAKLRANVVNMRALADVARRLGPAGLGAYLLLGKGEESTGGRDKASILADTLEALLGAIYLQYGLDTAAIVIHRLFDPLMAESAGRGAALDWKTSLQELTASMGLGVPEYRIDEAGPDHAKTFTAWVVVAGRKYGGTDGRSKKEAEQRAAEAAWSTLSPQRDGGSTAGPPVGVAEAGVDAGPEVGLGPDVGADATTGVDAAVEVAPGVEPASVGEPGARRSVASAGGSGGTTSNPN